MPPTDAEHSDGSAVGRVAVATHADLARHAKAGRMHCMADAVARPRDPHAALPRSRLQIDVVVRRFMVDVEQVVVQVAHTALRAHPGQADGLKGQIGHHRVDIVGQGLVYPEKNFFPGRQTALHIMRFDDFPGQRAALLRPLFLLFQSGPLL